MGCCSSKVSEDSPPKRYQENRSRDRHGFSADGSGFDREQIDAAIALSLMEQDQVAKQNQEGQRLTESKSQSANDARCTNTQLGGGNQHARSQSDEEQKQLAKRQLEEDEQLARVIQESLNAKPPLLKLAEDEKDCATSQLAGDEQLAKTIQESLNVEESPPRRVVGDEKDHAKTQLEEDELLAKTLQESLNVEESPRRRVVGDENDHAKAQVEEDELLAKTLQESLSVESPQKDGKQHVKDQPEEDELLAKACQESLKVESPSTCAGCNSKIEHGRFRSYLDAVWHPECFKCHSCNKPITDEFKFKKGIYHKSCYKELHHPKCIVCKDFIPPNSDGRTKYNFHPFWLLNYCPSHDTDGTLQCCSCDRFESKDVQYLLLDDGRKLCLECLDSAIMDSDHCQPLYFEIREFFEGLHMKVEQQFPLFLVERQALSNAMEEEKQGHHHVAVTRGLCLSEEQTIITVSKGPSRAGNRLTGVGTESHRVIRQRDVTAILIIYGLPRLLTGSILAHEMMHAWLRLNGYRSLKPEVEEGICQVLAHMWLESETYSGSGGDPAASSSSTPASSTKKGEQPDFEKKLSELFKHQIEKDSSPVYGDGFRKANEAVGKYGLERTLKYIKTTGNFP